MDLAEIKKSREFLETNYNYLTSLTVKYLHIYQQVCSRPKLNHLLAPIIQSPLKL